MQPVAAAGGLGDQVLVVESSPGCGGRWPGWCRRGRRRRRRRCRGPGAGRAGGTAAAGRRSGPGRTGRTRPRPTGSRRCISSSRSWAAARSAARPAAVQAGWWCSWRASIPIASGRYPHSRVISPAAASPAPQAGAAGQPGQQRRGLTGRQGVQADRRRILQRGQPPAAGDQHQAARRARQQRPDLLMPGRVIQQQQDLLPRQVITPPSRPSLQAGRDLLRGDPGGQQQAGQRIGRVHRPLAGRVRVQRQEELPVRETRRRAGARRAPRRWSCRSRPSRRSRGSPPPRRRAASRPAPPSAERARPGGR